MRSIAPYTNERLSFQLELPAAIRNVNRVGHAFFKTRMRFISGEINSEVDDQAAKVDEIKERYHDWHFNVRPSNTEPLLRLNLESLTSREHIEEKRDEVLGLIRG